MRYLCTIYTQDCTMTTGKGFVGTEPTFDEPIVSLVVGGSSLRQAAARAYTKSVGKIRARLLRQQDAPQRIVALETSPRAIALSLRKTMHRIGEVYEIDNLTQGWFIKVEPVSPDMNLPSRPHRLRLPLSVVIPFSLSPSPN